MGLTLQRIGILGGAFDPPHRAHVAMAEAAIAQFDLDELIVVPTGNAWHKPRDLSSGEHRAAMARLAFSHLSQARVDEIELHRQGPSYTIDTLRSFGGQFPGAQFFLLIGEDQGKVLATWHEIGEIAQRAIICVAEREMSESSDTVASSLDIPTQALKLPQLPHSATQIRARVAQGQAIDALVPPTVALYIQSHHLYLPAR
jgi:nicotinate-nucleotide adenylyltransferase